MKIALVKVGFSVSDEGKASATINVFLNPSVLQHHSTITLLGYSLNPYWRNSYSITVDDTVYKTAYITKYSSDWHELSSWVTVELSKMKQTLQTYISEGKAFIDSKPDDFNLSFFTDPDTLELLSTKSY